MIGLVILDARGPTDIQTVNVSKPICGVQGTPTYITYITTENSKSIFVLSPYFPYSHQSYYSICEEGSTRQNELESAGSCWYKIVSAILAYRTKIHLFFIV